MSGWDELAEFDSANPADDWRNLFLDVDPVGSRVTCDPAPTATDTDYLCLCSWWRGVPHKKLIAMGFQTESEHYVDEDSGPTRFFSYRRGTDNVNLIVTSDLDFCDKFMLATGLAKRLNVLDKDDRRALFQAIVYGIEWTGKE